ncbi:MAG: ThuA domain-containing protein [Flavobacteriaceae bacterium]|tara:strand:- start:534 stop:1583 length:1050 start_codon:yes stop_codon:yes gene_type:complete
MFSQKRILVYHETNQFRHESISAGISMFETLGDNSGNPIWITDNSQTSDVFTISNLAQYDAVVFLNTSGSDETGSDGDLLSASEKTALENFIASGKGFIGIHAATDTYRDQVWPFYNELVGAIVQTSPNHTNNNFNADMEVKASNPITDFLGSIGSIWNKNEEYYYWEQNGGQLSTDNTILLEVESTGSNTYDAARPTTWLKESITYDDDNNSITPEVSLTGIKSFYTSLGHNNSDYDSNTDFRTMLKNATLWAINNTLNINEIESVVEFKLVPNPVKNIMTVQFKNTNGEVNFKLFNTLGKEVFEKTINNSTLNKNEFSIDLSNLNSGIYLLKLSTKETQKSIKLVKN